MGDMSVKWGLSSLLFVPLMFAPSGPVAWFEGEVSDCVAGRSVPVSFANVMVGRYGGMTDASGRFRIASVPAGRWVVRVQCVGREVILDTMVFPEKGTVTKHYCFTGGPYPRFLYLRDSLVAQGRWHPTIDSTLAVCMHQAERIRVLRINWRDWSTRSFSGPVPVIAEGPTPSDSSLRELFEALEDSSLYIPVLQGDRHMCEYEPGVMVRFEREGHSMDMFLCFGCGEFNIGISGGVHQAGWIGPRAGPFIRLAREAFPNEPNLP
ncbi:MAG: carboxypeptidase regulatory-like domain-containing protein [Candidatus Eisenbacteria bacterium]|uniref:Carboxypeptidase regulatory-like domain-containing protein n=1 Tax=Eiseniibacteriota bacterium TaxID=2212470 RepID=A0A9D6QJX1_UNCEI|nr:carboxypeptidase regulatory-like domain-containing protein [Candidatus Eisenbacteria bacterium]MBI3539705.1 carboxypeptidase regulatory-like domain-containing protein [Candidatus Eisenbacteria bacterium]